MSRLLVALIASVCVFGPTAAMAQALDTSAPKTADEYKLARDPCNSQSVPGREQCAKVLKAADDMLRMRCGKLADQAKRECVLQAFVEQHDRMIGGDRIEKSGGAPSAGAQPK
jgi:hypothetical protein